MHRQLAGEPALVDAEAAAREAVAARAEPFAEMRDRPGPEGDVDVGIELEEPFALRLRIATADGDHLVRGFARLTAAAWARCAANFWSGFSRIVQVLKTRTSASS